MLSNFKTCWIQLMQTVFDCTCGTPPELRWEDERFMTTDMKTAPSEQIQFARVLRAPDPKQLTLSNTTRSTRRPTMNIPSESLTKHKHNCCGSFNFLDLCVHSNADFLSPVIILCNLIVVRRLSVHTVFASTTTHISLLCNVYSDDLFCYCLHFHSMPAVKLLLKISENSLWHLGFKTTKHGGDGSCHGNWPYSGNFRNLPKWNDVRWLGSRDFSLNKMAEVTIQSYWPVKNCTRLFILHGNCTKLNVYFWCVY